MKINLRVRDYIAGDFDQVNRVWIETGMGGSVRGDDAKIIDRTLKSGARLFVLENTSTNEIIGTSWLTHDERRIYMHHFGINPAYQGNGYAHKLMKASMEFARSTGLQIKLEVHHDNIKAIQLYKKWGFNYLGDYDVYIIRNYDSVPQD